MADEALWRPLHHAAYFGSHRVLALLLAAPRVDVNATDVHSWRPLDVCTTAKAACMLLDAGAAQSSGVPGSLSALHHAAYHARPDVVEVLLARGASVADACTPEAGRASINCSFGGTALHLSAASLQCAQSVRESLGAAFGVMAPEQAHAQAAATRRAAVCDLLLRAGADINALTRSCVVAAGEERMTMTPLVVSSQNGDAAVIRALLRAGAHADDVEPCTGASALHLAASGGHTDAIHALVAGGANVNKSSRPRQDRVITPLVRAVIGNHHAAVRALLELGADASHVAAALALPPAALLPRVVDDATRALVARHQRGAVAPARACSLRECEARRRLDYDDKKLLMCPCKVRAQPRMQAWQAVTAAAPCSLRTTAARSTSCWTASATRRRAKQRAARRKPPPPDGAQTTSDAAEGTRPLWTLQPSRTTQNTATTHARTNARTRWYTRSYTRSCCVQLGAHVPRAARAAATHAACASASRKGGASNWRGAPPYLAPNVD